MVGTYNGMRQAQGSVARGASLTSYVYDDYAAHSPAAHSPPELWTSPGSAQTLRRLQLQTLLRLQLQTLLRLQLLY